MSELTKEEIDLITNVIPEADLVPVNAPKAEEIDQWQARIGKWFLKFDTKKNEVQKGLYFEPTNLFPEYNLEKNTVKYRFHVRMHLGYALDAKGNQLNGKNGMPHIVKLARRPDGPAIDRLIDVAEFIKDYKPA